MGTIIICAALILIANIGGLYFYNQEKKAEANK